MCAFDGVKNENRGFTRASIPSMTSAFEPVAYLAPRRSMVESQLRARGITDQRVLAAMERVPRHEFVPKSLLDEAYNDHPLPIGIGQTISQPYMVAIMLEALKLTPSDNVLEVGTGSGYVTALLAEMVAQIVTIERHAGLANRAEQLLASLGYRNIQFVIGDGSFGLPQQSPYDAIIVSAATTQIPPALLAQLREPGRMIIPVGPGDDQQELQLIEMQNGQPHVTARDACRFVPLVSGTK
jgi:protein-L-isoaspartate(D-aspartate) O-methyltransferase